MMQTPKKKNKWVVLALLVVISLCWYFFSDDLTFAKIKYYQQKFATYYQENPIESLTEFFIVYVATSAVAIPTAGLLTLLAGALFGSVVGFTMSAVACLVGCVLSFLLARYLLRDFIISKFRKQLEFVNRGIHQGGDVYLLSLRVACIIPYFIINIAVALTDMSLLRYTWLTGLGLIPSTLAYVQAGESLAEAKDPSELLSWEVLVALLVLAALPMAAKKMADLYKKHVESGSDPRGTR